MSIWNKILVGLIFIASVAFFYMAARTLKTHKYWRNVARGYELFLDVRKQYSESCQRGGELVAIKAEDNELSRLLRTGDINLDALQNQKETVEETPGIKQLRAELQRLDRRRVWYNCSPGQVTVDPQNETVRVPVATDRPIPHGIADKTILYVFEETPVNQKGQYLGKFTVTAVAEGQVVLEPSRKKVAPNSREIQRLIASPKKPNITWTMYEQMPVDKHEAFAHLSEDELKGLLAGLKPLPEYLNDGKSATWEEMEEWGAEGVLVDAQGKALVDADGNKIPGATGTYVRWLRDYDVLFDNYYVQRDVLAEVIKAATRDRDYAKAAADDAQVQLKFRTNEKTQLDAELAKVREERRAVEEYRNDLEAKVAELRRQIVQLVQQNQATAGQIAKLQLDAARLIDERTRRMARAKAGGE